MYFATYLLIPRFTWCQSPSHLLPTDRMFLETVTVCSNFRSLFSATPPRVRQQPSAVAAALAAFDPSKRSVAMSKLRFADVVDPGHSWLTVQSESTTPSLTLHQLMSPL